MRRRFSGIEGIQHLEKVVSIMSCKPEKSFLGHGLARSLALGWIATVLPIMGAESTPLAIGSRLELLVDSYLIDHFSGTELRPNRPVDAGTVLSFDQAWEGQYSIYATVIKDGPIYRFYYRGTQHEPDFNPDVNTCYAESRDGVHWEKPDLELYGHTNVILQSKTTIGVSTTFTPMLDTRPGTPQTERYKALGGGWFKPTPEYPYTGNGYWALSSEDGIHWRKMQEKEVITLEKNYPVPGIDTSVLPSFWSESDRCYVAYMRTFADGGRRGGDGADYNAEAYPPPGHIHIRSVGRLTSPDYIHWSKVQMMTYGDTPPDQLYNNTTSPYFRAPHLLISLVPRIVFDRPAISPEEEKAIGVAYDQSHDAAEVVLMTSRGGNRYDRPFMDAYIRNEIGPENWTSRDHYPAVNVVPTGRNEMSFFVVDNYAQPTCHLERYALRLDRFASVHAPFRGGEFTTLPLTFTGGKLWINYSTSVAGSVRVEIQDASGRPVPGFSLADSIELFGNKIEQAVGWKSGAVAVRQKWTGDPDNRREIVSTTWEGGDDISHLAGRAIRLRFVMRAADLYALRFR